LIAINALEGQGLFSIVEALLTMVLSPELLKFYIQLLLPLRQYKQNTSLNVIETLIQANMCTIFIANSPL